MSYNINSLLKKILSGNAPTKEDALTLAAAEGPDIFDLFSAANILRSKHRGDAIDLCSIASAKTGHCPEDCSYCAQSKIARAKITTHPLKRKESVLEMAMAAKAQGIKRFCIVISGKKATPSELKQIASMIKGVREAGLLPCATLGLLGRDELLMLKDAGLERYHHNLETSRRFFPEICSSHTYDDKLKTIDAVKSAGLSLCSGGIFGMGEEWEDRVEMAMELKSLAADSIPINFLVPIKGTQLEKTEPLPPLDALKIISLYRFILPDKEIRVCGGRLQTLGEFNSFIFMAGADGLLTGDCLTTQGRRPEDDLALIKNYGLKVA